MKLYNANDWHLGAIRTGGTTPYSSWQMRCSLPERAAELLAQIDADFVFNGDLFDTAQVPNSDLLRTLEVFATWLKKGHHLYLGRANHDVNKNSTILSSFDLFGNLVKRLAPDQVTVVTEPTAIPAHNAYMIPHLPNQDIFNEALKAVPPCKWLFVHANYDNQFAVEADHSLNLSKEQAEALPVERIIFGHEHQGRTELGGKVVVVGNQFPTSVADCLGNDVKNMLKIEGDKLHFIQTWDASKGFSTPDWRHLDEDSDEHAFVRVEGTATAEEATNVISAISRFRSRSAAFVVTNAVTIDGVSTDEEAIRASLSEAKGFDVIEALLSLLDEGFEKETVKTIIEKHNVQTSQVE